MANLYWSYKLQIYKQVVSSSNMVSVSSLLNEREKIVGRIQYLLIKILIKMRFDWKELISFINWLSYDSVQQRNAT